DFALQAFERDVFDFLAKPISLARFQKTIERCRDGYRFTKGPEGETYFFIRAERRGRWIKISYADLACIDAAQNYVRFHLQDRPFLVYLSLKEVKAHLPEGRFIQVHRSFIINLDHVQSLDGNLIQMSEGLRPVQVSSGYRQEFEKWFRNYVLQSGR